MKKSVYMIIMILLLSGCSFSQKEISLTPQELPKGISFPEQKPIVNEKEITNVLAQNKEFVQTGIIQNDSPEIKNNSGSLVSSGVLAKKEVSLPIDTSQPSESTSQPDNSVTKFVNDTHHFTHIDYVPDDLVALTGEYIVDNKGKQVLRKPANDALQRLAEDFFSAFGKKLVIVSAYRSYEYQKGIKQRGCSDIFCAKPGYSEHQTGLAVDIFEATSQTEFLSKPELKKYFDWMTQHASQYGFHNSYQNGKKIDGYAIEPWHWRYLGVDFAQYLSEHKMTYAQYYHTFGEKE